MTVTVVREVKLVTWYTSVRSGKAGFCYKIASVTPNGGFIIAILNLDGEGTITYWIKLALAYNQGTDAA